MDLGGYAAAAKTLNVTKSAVSQSITGLEAQLGVQLFLRRSKKLIPTDKGLKLFEEFKHHHNKLLKTVEELSEGKNTVKGLVRVGAYLEFAKKELSPFLKSFLHEHSGAQVKLKFESPSRLKDLLERNKLDLIFSIYPVRGVKGLTSVKFLNEELVMICKKGESSKFKRLQDFQTANYVAYFSDQKSLRKWMGLHFSKRFKNLEVPLLAATAEMVLSCVKEGLGIGVVPDYLVDSSVEVLRPTDKKLEDHIWLSHFEGQFSNTAHKEFIARVKGLHL